MKKMKIELRMDHNKFTFYNLQLKNPVPLWHKNHPLGIFQTNFGKKAFFVTWRPARRTALGGIRFIHIGTVSLPSNPKILVPTLPLKGNLCVCVFKSPMVLMWLWEEGGGVKPYPE